MEKDIASKLEALFKKYNRLMYTIAFRILNDHQLAQDAVQMSFIKIMNNIKKINEIDSNKTKIYVVIICRNVSINLYNKRKRNDPIALEDIDESLADNANNIDENIINMEKVSELKEKTNMLNQSYADIIALKYVLGYSEKEIAKMLDISEENVRVRLHRAKNTLIKLLRNEGEII